MLVDLGVPELKCKIMKISILIILFFSAFFISQSFGSKLKVDIESQITTIDFNVDIVPIKNGKKKFDCNDVHWLSLSGEPQIPYKIFNILLPPDVDGSTITVEAKVKYEKIKGEYIIYPVPPLVAWDGENKIIRWPKDKKIEDNKDIEIYNKNQFWPKKQIFLTQIGKLRQYNLAQIAVPLVQYNPIKKEIRKITDTDIFIKYKKKEVVLKKRLDLIGKKRTEKITINSKQFIKKYE